jgi:hypothetical protein
MSRYLEIPVSGPQERVAARAREAFRSIGRVETFEAVSHISGTIRCDGGTARVTVRWRASGDNFLLDIEANSGERLYRVADRALYLFAGEYKDIVLAEREAHEAGQELFESDEPWYYRLWRGLKGQ